MIVRLFFSTVKVIVTLKFVVIIVLLVPHFRFHFLNFQDKAMWYVPLLPRMIRKVCQSAGSWHPSWHAGESKDLNVIDRSARSDVLTFFDILDIVHHILTYYKPEPDQRSMWFVDVLCGLLLFLIRGRNRDTLDQDRWPAHKAQGSR